MIQFTSPYGAQKGRILQTRLALLNQRDVLRDETDGVEEPKLLEQIRLKSEALSQKLIALRNEELHLERIEANHAISLISVRLEEAKNVLDSDPERSNWLVNECLRIDCAFDLPREVRSALTDISCAEGLEIATIIKAIDLFFAVVRSEDEQVAA